MSHETHHTTHNHPENKPTTSFRSSFWFVIILVGLFIAALNFVNIMGNDNGEGNEIKMEPKPVEAPRDATASQTLAGEKGEGIVVDSNAHNSTAPDTLHTQKH